MSTSPGGHRLSSGPGTFIKENEHWKQESIPVGCVPPAFVVRGEGEGFSPGGIWSRGYNPPCTEWQTPVKTLFSRNFVGGAVLMSNGPPCDSRHKCHNFLAFALYSFTVRRVWPESGSFSAQPPQSTTSVSPKKLPVQARSDSPLVTSQLPYPREDLIFRLRLWKW